MPIYALPMVRVTACDVPEGSLLAGYGGPGDYRDCFCREVPGVVSLTEFIERFYCSAAFRPERLALGLMGRGASNADARALARGKTDRIAVWEVIERRSAQASCQGADPGERPASRKPDRASAGPEGRGDRSADALRNTKTLSEILLHSKGTGTASWLAVEPLGDSTRLLFGTWVGKPERPIMLALYRLHRLYSQILLGGV